MNSKNQPIWRLFLAFPCALALAAVSPLSVAAVGCVDSTDGTRCTPLHQQTCACDSALGNQSCRLDGSGWDACVCTPDPVESDRFSPERILLLDGDPDSYCGSDLKLTIQAARSAIGDDDMASLCSCLADVQVSAGLFDCPNVESDREQFEADCMLSAETLREPTECTASLELVEQCEVTIALYIGTDCSSSLPRLAPCEEIRSLPGCDNF